MSNNRVLIIDDSTRAAVAEVISYAKDHPYGKNQPTPGDNAKFVAELRDGFRVVFTFTDMGGVLWRHISISVSGAKYPNPAAAFMIAELFGFTGWDGKTIDAAPQDWVLNVSQPEHCIVLAQPIGVTEKLVS